MCPQSGFPNPYTVQRNDGWIKIAARCGVTYEQLRQANWSLWLRRGVTIWPGDVMVIPGHASAGTQGGARPGLCPVVYTVVRNDSWYGIAGKCGVPFWMLRQANWDLWLRRGANIWPGDRMVMPYEG